MFGQTKILALIVAILLSPTVVLSQTNGLRLSVMVQPTEDRFITFNDGNRLFHGMEVSYILEQYLFDSKQFVIVTPNIPPTPGLSTMSTRVSTNGEILRELAARLPNFDFNYIKDYRPQNSAGMTTLSTGGLTTESANRQARADVYVTPRVETLLYSSGQKSNRIVYGFAPDRLNPFNEGRAGGLDNEFIPIVNSDPAQPTPDTCANIDFFGGQLNVEGYGPWLSNFGSNSDEGFMFSILGYGFGFKKKSFEVKSELVFAVEIPSFGFKKEYRYSLKGGGTDIFVGGEYQGISIGVEVQRNKSLRQALTEMAPSIVSTFAKELPKLAWQTQVVGEYNGMWVILGGVQNGVSVGLKLISKSGLKFQVNSVGDTYAFVMADPSNSSLPSDGEVLLASDGSGLGVKGMGLASVLSTPQDTTLLPDAKISNTTQGAAVAPILSCIKTDYSWFEKLLMQISWIYGYVRYHTVFDQAYNNVTPVQGAPKIALIGSGVYPKESSLKKHLDSSGFDFISWDTRPGDDLGQGTASALLLNSKTKSNYTLVPMKVIDTHGETTSSALYQALEYASKRIDIDYVVIPFKPSIDSQAYRQGVQLCLNSHKTVIVPSGMNIPGATEAPKGANEYKTGGLSAPTIHLAVEGVGVMEKLADILNQNKR